MKSGVAAHQAKRDVPTAVKFSRPSADFADVLFVNSKSLKLNLQLQRFCSCPKTPTLRQRSRIARMSQFIFYISFLFLNVAFAADQAVVIKPYSVEKYKQQFQDFYKIQPEMQSKNLAERFNTASKYFMGKPYLLGALGEGPDAKFDRSPLFRTDAFDCVTYVSTVLAMVESTDFQQFYKNLLAIQYSNATPSYLTRNHFMSVDWNLNNQKQGYLTDVTKSLFPKNYKIADALINKPAWFNKLQANNLKQFKALNPEQTTQLLNELHDLSKQTSASMSHLAYVPLTALFDKDGKPIMSQFDKIPNDVVIEMVRPNWDLTKVIGTNMNVSHLGLGIWVNHMLMFREASLIDHKVEDVPLAKYLAGYLNSPTLKGINIQLINFKNSTVIPAKAGI